MYDGWRYPDEWITEAYALEGPKLFRRGEWFYLVSAVGGTGGPATGHMVIVARSRSVHGPWENAPGNPIARTRSADEAWWSRGHATILDAPDGSWWMVSHGYAQRLPHARAAGAAGADRVDGGRLAGRVRSGCRRAARHARCRGSRPGRGSRALRRLRRRRLGRALGLRQPGARTSATAPASASGLVLAAKGTSPADSSPLTTWSMDDAYEVEVEAEVRGRRDRRPAPLLQRPACSSAWAGTARRWPATPAASARTGASPPSPARPSSCGCGTTTTS